MFNTISSFSSIVAAGEETSFGDLMNTFKNTLSFGLSDQLDNPECIPAFLVGQVLDWVSVLIGLVLLGYLIYGGIQWVMSAGDPQRLEQAKNILTNAIIGFVIVILAWSVVNILSGLFGIESACDMGSESGCPTGQFYCGSTGGCMPDGEYCGEY